MNGQDDIFANMIFNGISDPQQVQRAEQPQQLSPGMHRQLSELKAEIERLSKLMTSQKEHNAALANQITTQQAKTADRFASQERRLAAQEQRMAVQEQRMATLEQRRADIEQRLADQEKQITDVVSNFEQAESSSDSDGSGTLADGDPEYEERGDGQLVSKSRVV